MFSGIIETLGKIKQINVDSGNLLLTIEADFLNELYIDQSIAHNGVCLTVTSIDNNAYQVVAIQETLLKSNLRSIKENNIINLERCVQMHSRLDGHLVQGHVDTIGICTSIEENEGSWVFSFTYNASFSPLIVPKGSITVNGVSLTVVEADMQHFSVAIIPYTYYNTTFHELKKGDSVNLEFDIVGKYIHRHIEHYLEHHNKFKNTIKNLI